MEVVKCHGRGAQQCPPRRGPVTGPMTGCSFLLSDEMEVKKLIRKPLHPARPIRRCAPDSEHVFMVNLRAEISDFSEEDLKDSFDLLCGLYEVLKDPPVPKTPEKPQMQTKKGRITYSRECLIQLSKMSVSRQKPKYLPDHPIVLKQPLSPVCDETPVPAPSSVSM